MTNRTIRIVRGAAGAALVAFTALASREACAQGAGQATGQPRVRDRYETHNSAAVDARTAGDWASARRHAAAIDTLFNGSPAALMAVARASAQMGDVRSAVQTVTRVLAMGVMRNLNAERELAPIHATPEWKSLLAADEANARSIGTPRLLFTLPVPDLIAEDIVYDAARYRYLVSSVRKKNILIVHRDGTVGPFIIHGTPGISGVFALAIDSARSILWATTAAMTHVEGFSEGDPARAAVLRFDLATGVLQARYEIASSTRGSVPGDITLSPGGDLYISDSRSGIVYVIRRGTDLPEVVVPEGTFMSPQGPALSPDGRSLFVADYIRGLAEVNLASGAVRWIRSDAPVALSGIDGLSFAGPAQLIAVQNGVMPNRVLSLTLDRPRGLVTASRVLAQDTALIRDPTHGVTVDGEFHFIANSGWDVFDQKGVPGSDRPMIRPAILSIGLRIPSP